MNHVLTLNAGSSTLKFALFKAAAEPRNILTGLVDHIGGAAVIKLKDAEDNTLISRQLPTDQAANHDGAVQAALAAIQEQVPEAQIKAVGHRIVHGGVNFSTPVALCDDTIAALKVLNPLAPLHQPHNLAGVYAARTAFPEAVQVGCFDTGFHRQQSFVNDAYALPRRYYEQGVRRYGFHGMSYDFISGNLAEIAPDLHAGRVIVAHLGNGASLCALQDGRSVASTMGFSALDGLAMGTRCGQLDPGVMLYLMTQESLSADQISRLLYHDSGLLGLSGISNDMRSLLESDDPKADQAIDYFCHRIRREIGGLAATLGGLDGLVFTGGIGENASAIRDRVCDGMDWIGIELDKTQNEAHARVINAANSKVAVMVIPTNEELVIARAAAKAL